MSFRVWSRAWPRCRATVTFGGGMTLAKLRAPDCGAALPSSGAAQTRHRRPSTAPDSDADTTRRFLVTHVDESAEQLRAVLTFQRMRRTLSGSRDDAAVARVVQRNRTFQRLLRSLAVVNPFGTFLAYGDDRLQGRRDHGNRHDLRMGVS